MRRFSTARQRWDYCERYGHDGQAWVEVLRGNEDDAVELRSAFLEDTYIGNGTILQRDLTNMPIHPDSEAMGAWMMQWSPFGPATAYGSATSINTSAYGTQPIHMYVVDSTHPDCHFRTFAGSVVVGTPNVERDTYMNGQIPLPSWAVPAQNGDRGMAVYDIGTGIMREYFNTQTPTTGAWSGTGGYSISRPGLRHVAQDNWALQQRRGLSNAAGMHNSLGFIGITEALEGKINHALCYTLGTSWGLNRTKAEVMAEYETFPNNPSCDPANPTAAPRKLAPAEWPGGGSRMSWPARANDGKAERYIPESTWGLAKGNKTYTGDHRTPTHGQWGRMKASVDPQWNPNTGKPYPKFTRVLIDAAKQYGVVATDTNLWCNAFNTEQGRTFKHLYGTDPWSAANNNEGIVRKQYINPDTGLDEFSANDFPWDQVEWATLDWGRPSPDFNLKPGQNLPWYRPGDPNAPRL